MEPEGWIPAEQVGQAIEVAPDAIADDEKEKASRAKVSADGIHERCLSFRQRSVVGRRHSLPNGAVIRNGAHRLIEILERHHGQCCGVIEDLAHDLAARLWVAPQLRLNEG